MLYVGDIGWEHCRHTFKLNISIPLFMLNMIHTLDKIDSGAYH